MKKFLLLTALCLMFLSSCKPESDEPEIDESFEEFIFTSCGCGCDELTEGFTWPKEYPVWYYPIRWWIKDEWIGGALSRDEYLIPENVLTSLSTDDLAELCVAYPPLVIFPIYEYWNYAIERMIDEFNGLEELFQRKGASDVLLKLYQNMLRNYSFQCNREQPGSDYWLEAFFDGHVHCLELLLSCEFPHDDVNYRKILQTLVVSYEELSKNYQEYYSIYANIFARAHLIIRINPKSIEKFPGKEKNSVFARGYCTQETLDIINELSYQLINQKKP